MRTALILLTWLCLGAQAFHYLGYPLLLLLLATLRRRTTRGGAGQPSATLVISAYNEAAIIGEKLRNSLALDYPGLRIVVVSDGSSDDTAAIVAGFAGSGVVGLHRPERRGKADAINRGAMLAESDIVVLSDANALYAPDAVARLAAAFADPTVGCVTGRRTVRPPSGAASAAGGGESLYWRYESIVKRLESRLGSTVAVTGEILAVRRNLLPALPAGLINDDAYIALAVLRRGRRVLYEPAALCWEAPSGSMGDEIVRRRRITAGRYQLLLQPGWWPWRRPGPLAMLVCHKLLRLLLPFLMIGALAANLALAAWPAMPWALQATLAAQLAFYGLALTGFLAERAGRRWRIPAAAYYLTIGNLGALGGFLRFVAGGQSVLWEKAARPAQRS
jgi:cellulose synthase/poly-beta-1,6-N-acetylglucosamine synthase-like glycosyltransferase